MLHLHEDFGGLCFTPVSLSISGMEGMSFISTSFSNDPSQFPSIRGDHTGQSGFLLPAEIFRTAPQIAQDFRWVLIRPIREHDHVIPIFAMLFLLWQDHDGAEEPALLLQS